MISLDEWKQGGEVFHYRGHPIFVRRAGPADGAPLLLIHGFPTASWDWEALWPALTARLNVLTLDMIGFGFSAKPQDYAYSIKDQADLFEAYLNHLGVSRYHVLAHDYGDTVAQELLARQTESGSRPLLDSLVLLNGGLFPETHRPLLAQKLLLSPLGAIVARLLSRDKLAASMRRIFGPHSQPADETLHAFWRLIEFNEGPKVMHKLIHYITERRQNRDRWVGALQTTKLPLRLIDGVFDPISGGHMVQRYVELVPNPDVVRLPEVGHYPQVEAPEAVLQGYLAFRERV